MNLKKFISGVSAFAIAASAFAAMAVTAGAADYNETITIGSGDVNNIASYNSAGLATAKTLTSGQYAAIRKDFSDLTDISKASTVTVEFKTAVSKGNVVVFGFGDASARTAVASGSGNYAVTGLGLYFGSVDGTNYKAYDVKSDAALNIGASAFGKVVTGRITLDREAHTYSYYIGYSDTAKIEGNGIATNIDNLTYVDAYTKTSGAAFQFKDITVSYTVDDEPVVVTPEFNQTGSAAFTGDDSSEAVIVKGEISGVDTIDSITITADGQTKTKVNGTDYNFSTNFGGAEAVIAIIVNGVSEVTSIAIN